MSSPEHRHPEDREPDGLGSQRHAYLCDKSGIPDADVERLERLLRPLGTSDDVGVPAIRTLSRRRVPSGVTWLLAPVAAAAVLLLAVWAVDAQRSSRHAAEPQAQTADVAAASDPRRPTVRDATAGRTVHEDGWVETTDAPRELTVGDGLGRITLGAQSRLQVREVSAETTRLFLARGSLEARVSADARPRFFQVDTDAARCVDLGCRYTLDVAQDGVATVRVMTGQVAFETGTHEAFVPAGAVCVARKGRGPGTPRFEDAGDVVREAFDAYDAAPAERRTALARAALDAVRDVRDTLPAWHLLQDADPDVVAAAVARLEAVAGACDAPATSSPADLRAAWKQHLESRWW